ncbi:two-component system, chemotaxis family, response regulator CheB [Borreliella japonica]|uniref:protein-glutamate methylesterase n=1 Tax=Borreliella japonica TaxID=34095 RepID=A0A1G4PEB3_BORJA|nr:chemotaxis protein CheB [Borreliella japonica]WKC89021.1 chemotaxis protein CheB [Borreliella japonica]SCW30643.1 two-component system, chemotaxis family, response regulator CheB [Borreliella japonica]
METKISVLVIEYFAVKRKLISDLINSSPKLKVIATASNGKFATNKLKKHNPEVILMNLEENNSEDILFLEKKNNIHKTIPIVVTSSNQNLINIAALKGADDLILVSKNKKSHENKKEQIISSLLAYGSISIKNKIVHNKYMETKNYEKANFFLNHKNDIFSLTKLEEYTKEKILNEKEIKKLKMRKFDIIAIGISAGGPVALKSILPEIPESFPPIIIVQHMPKGFTEEFAKNLNNLCKISVKETTNKEILKQGHAYISSGGHHTKIKKIDSNYQIQTFDGKHINGHKPSIGVLFQSIAEIAKDKAIALIMTGMGNDGSREIGDIKKAGGLTIAQDEESSMVFGMPKIAIEENNIDYIVPLNHMVKLLKAILTD